MTHQRYSRSRYLVNLISLISRKDNTWVVTLITGLLGALSAIIAPFALVAGASTAAAAGVSAGAKGAAAGGSSGSKGAEGAVSAGTNGAAGGSAAGTIGNGIAHSSMEGGVATYVSPYLPKRQSAKLTDDDRIQSELDKYADLQKVIGDRFSFLKNATRDWAIGAINSPLVNEGGNPYYKNTKGAYHILHDGFYGNEKSADITKEVDNNLMKAFNGASISALWHAENVFMVRVSRKTKLLRGADPCKIKLDKNIKQFCEDDVVWFLLKASEKHYEQKYPAVPGADKVGDYKFKLLDMMKEAWELQKKVGYKRDWETKWIMEQLTGKEAPKSGSMMPIVGCDLTALKESNDWPEEAYYISRMNCASPDVSISSLIGRCIADLFLSLVFFQVARGNGLQKTNPPH